MSEDTLKVEMSQEEEKKEDNAFNTKQINITTITDIPVS
jgi:hypothetical protein